jgi:hypothetical protein
MNRMAFKELRAPTKFCFRLILPVFFVAFQDGLERVLVI